MTITPNLFLNLPSPNVTPGPLWADNINTAMEVIDLHDHTDNKGIRITPAAMNINTGLDFNSNEANSLNSVQMVSLPVPINPTGSGLLRTYVSLGNLFYNDGAGNSIQLTNNGSPASGTASQRVQTVNNSSLSPITKGSPVYVHGVASGVLQVRYADNGDPTEMPAIGIARSDIASGDDGIIIVWGLFTGFDTSAWTVGTEIFVGTNGSLTSTRPSHPLLEQSVGFVSISDAADGAIIVDISSVITDDASGTKRNEFTIGDSAATVKRLSFDNGATESSFAWNPTQSQAITLPPTRPSVGQAPVVSTVSGGDVVLKWGEAGGGGDINYIVEAGITSTFEGPSSTGWNRYANTTPGPVPEANASGSPTANPTFGTSVFEPLVGLASGQLAKDGANRQGQGVRTNWMTIDNAYTESFLSGSFLVNSQHPNYVAGDVTVWIEVDLGFSNFAIIPTTQREIALGKYEHVFTFDTMGSFQYRFLLHISTVNAAVYDIKIDNVFIGPNAGAIGILDREELLVSVAGSGNFTAGSFRLIREGRIVTLNQVESFTFPSDSQPESAVGVIPQRFRPEVNVVNVTLAAPSHNYQAIVFADGKFRIDIRNWSGTLTALTLITDLSMAYGIAAANYQPAANIDLVKSPSPFEEITVTGTTASAITTAYTLQLRRVANMVFATANCTPGIASAANQIRLDTAVPARFRPAASTTISAGVVRNAGNATLGFAEVTGSDGTVRFFKGDKTNYTGSSAIGSASNQPTNFFWRIRDAEGYEDFANQVYAALPQRDYFIEGSGMTALANNTDTDITNGAFFLPAGRYTYTASGLLVVNHSVVPTSARGVLLLTTTGNAIIGPLSGGEYFSAIGPATSTSNSTRYHLAVGPFDWAGGTVKLICNVNNTGGTVSSRQCLRPMAHFTRLQN